MAVDRYVIDLVRDELLIEIQTRGFASMRKKLERLLEGGHQVRIVYPVAVVKTIVKLGEDGEVLSRRRSPKRGTALDIFSELVSIPHLIDHPGLSLQVLLITEDEYRTHDPDKAWRRKGWVVQERRLTGIEDEFTVAGNNDLVGLLPGELPDAFTTADIVARAGCSLRTAQQMTYCLRKAHVIEVCGKQGRSMEYRLV